MKDEEIEKLMRQYREIGVQYGWLDRFEKPKMSDVLKMYKALNEFLAGDSSLAKEMRRKLQTQSAGDEVV